MTGAVEDASQLQEDAGKFGASTAGSQLGRTQWQLAVQKGRQSQGSELVSRQFRKQRLAVWAAGRGPDPSLTATVF